MGSGRAYNLAVLGLAMATVLLACRGPSPFEVHNAPFEGSYEGAFEFSPREIDEETGEVVEADLHLEVSGEATQVGNGEARGDLLLNFRETPPRADGEVTILSENGGEVWLVLEGTAAASGVIGGLLLEGSFHVAGGTGLFSRATGEGTFQGGGSLLTRLGTVTYSGTISY